MIVAAGTSNRHAEDHAGGNINLLINQIVIKLTSILFGQCLGTDRQKTGRHKIFRPLLIGFYWQEITGDLLFNKFVVRLV